MQLVEFMAYWPGDYSREEIETYTILHGEDRTKWPPTNSYTPITVDIDLVTRFNPAYNGENITVDFSCANPITINMPYDEFKDLLKYFNIEIHSTLKNAL